MAANLSLWVGIMNHKLKSVKLWLTLFVFCVSAYLNFHGSINGDQFIDFAKWVLGIYTAGNVGAKMAVKVSGDSK